MQLLAQHHMELQLPASTPTFQSDSHCTWTTLNLFFCDSDLTHHIQSCDTSPDDCLPAADHLPIHTWIDVELNRRQTTPGCCCDKTDMNKPSLIKNIKQRKLKQIRNDPITTHITPKRTSTSIGLGNQSEEACPSVMIDRHQAEGDTTEKNRRDTHIHTQTQDPMEQTAEHCHHGNNHKLTHDTPRSKQPHIPHTGEFHSSLHSLLIPFISETC